MYMFINICMYIYICIYVYVFCVFASIDFFGKQKNTQLSMQIFFPSFLVETGETDAVCLPGWLETRWTLRTKIQAPDR